MHTRPVWAEIDLARLACNYQHLRAVSQRAALPTEQAPDVLAVVKADAYGHSLSLCAPALIAVGATWLGVTSVEEGVALRALPGAESVRILIMSGIWQGEADAVIAHTLTPQIWEPYHFELLIDAAGRRSLGPGSIPVHLEIDTGMARQGIAPGPALDHLLTTFCAPGSPIRLEGVMTHFSAPEVIGPPPQTGFASTHYRVRSETDHQVERFTAACQQLQAHGISPQWLHAGNSATLVDQQPVSRLASLATSLGARLMLRPGLSLYGYPVRFTQPTPFIVEAEAALRPVLSWKTRITSLRTIATGEGAGYNSTFRATRPTRLALTPAGYADGLNRLLSNRGTMLIRGLHAPIAGRISMDQTILDVTDIPAAAIGDEAVILGEQRSEPAEQAPQQGKESTAPSANLTPPGMQPPAITAYDQADLCNTIPYEILCNISHRVPRTPTR